jgi:RNA polymerase sigma-54 factor
MSNFELVEYLNEEIQENPVIDADFSKIEVNENFEKSDYNKLSEHSGNDNYSSGVAYGEEKVSPFNFISEKKSLKDYLKEQLGELDENDKIKDICMYIIEGINSSGYFTDDLDETSKFLNVDRKNVEDALEIIKTFDPSGIGAVNLIDCLKIQADDKGLLDDKLELIISNHLEDIGDNRYIKIAKELNISVKQAQQYGDEIKTFQPKPSSGFYTGDEVKYINPDAYIESIGDELYIIMNDTSLPNLSINNIYKDILNGNEDKNAKKYVREKITSATFLIKSISMRRSTVQKVLEQIVDIQKKYFLIGDSFLEAMTLKDISERIDMHESTVSRAIKEKYVYTNRGIIRIKDLFTTAIINSNSEDISVNKIKDEVQKLIESEDNAKPLSDQNISDVLADKDFKVSRRTVAKYREEMGIKSSTKRKRF